jgi:hypothetical protein
MPVARFAMFKTNLVLQTSPCANSSRARVRRVLHRSYIFVRLNSSDRSCYLPTRCGVGQRAQVQACCCSRRHDLSGIEQTDAFVHCRRTEPPCPVEDARRSLQPADPGGSWSNPDKRAAVSRRLGKHRLGVLTVIKGSPGARSDGIRQPSPGLSRRAKRPRSTTGKTKAGPVAA